MNVGELEWTATLRLTDAGAMSEYAHGTGSTPERALDSLERLLACQADELAGRLERVRAARAAVPIAP